MKLKMFVDPPIAATLFPVIKGVGKLPFACFEGISDDIVP